MVKEARRLNVKKVLLPMACVATLLVSSTAMAFADDVNPKSTPAHINVPATAIDFSVTEKINMVGTENSTDLTVDSLEVTNNSAMGVINIDSVEVQAVDGWSIVAYDTDFTTLAANAGQFGLQADGAHDMASAYDAAGEVNPGATDTTAFEGKTGMVTTAIDDEKVADVVTTVSFK